MFSTLLALAVMAQAGSSPPAAPAAAPPTTQAAAQAANAPDKDPVLCHRVTPVGSRLPQKVCARKSILEQQKRDGRRVVDDIQAHSHGPFIPPP